MNNKISHKKIYPSDYNILTRCKEMDCRNTWLFEKKSSFLY